jgi:hypothetical protein
MKYAVEMGSGVMIYIPSFIKIGLGYLNMDLQNKVNAQQAAYVHGEE